jgi:CubicO group peptidase (beta-lactamase class C family)
MKKIFFTCFCLAYIFRVYAQVHPIDTFISHFASRNNFNGTILIENQGKTIYRKSFGWASLEWQVPNSPETRYRVASITKAFTSTLILQLYEQGKIDLDKPFGTYLKNYQGPAGSKVTIRQLLHMTSGMHNMDEGTTLESVLQKGLPQYQAPRTVEQMIAQYGTDTLVNTPGKQFDYNNMDFILLGRIVEELTGQSFAQALHKNILEPLKMYNTGIQSQDTLIPKLASTYFMRPDLKRLVPDLPVYWQDWYASGNMYATADDLKLFCNALFGGKLLNPQTLKEFFVSGPGEYGLGVWVYKDYNIHHKMYTIIKRPGQIMGAQSMLFHILETNQSIIILSNTGTVSLDDFAAALANWVVK